MSVSSQKVAFEDFVLDLDEQVLLQNGKPVSITPKAMLLLCKLAENPGRLMEKSTLMEAVWPDSFVEEGNLSFTMNLLRKVLGDTTSDPQFIETVPRRGYRFIAQVTPVAPPTPEPTAEEADPSPGRSVVRRYVLPAGAVGLVVLLGVAVWYAARHRGVPTAPILAVPFSVEQLPTSGNSEFAAISPDGKYAAYRDLSGGKQSIWLRNLETSENVQIVPPGDEDYLGITFSGGGTALYLVRKPSVGHIFPALYRVETPGGIPIKIADNVNRRAAVTLDDKQIAFVRCMYRRTDFCSLFVADADGQNERKLLTTDNGYHIHDIRFAPDGRTIAMASGRLSNDKNDAKVSEIDTQTGAEREMFSERFYDITGIEWLPNGSGLLFAASDFKDGKAAIRMVSRATGKLSELSKDAASYAEPSLDREGRRLIAVQVVPDFRITVAGPGTTATLGGARNLDTSAGGKIVYTTFDGEIWTVNRDGTEQRQLTNTPFAETNAHFSPDRKSIYFSADDGGSRQVWRMNADGSDRKQLTQQVGGYPLSVSSDGQFVFYRSTLGDLIYKVPTAGGGGETLVHDKRFANASVSPNGEMVAHFIVDKGARKIVVSSLKTGEDVKVLEPGADNSFGDKVVWSADGLSFNYVVSDARSSSLYRQTLEPSDTGRKVADLTGEDIIAISAEENGSFAYISGKWKFDVMLLRGLG